jgi:hypothetical protein
MLEGACISNTSVPVTGQQVAALYCKTAPPTAFLLLLLLPLH